jgi:Dna[CI] antecedent, DciA
MKRHNDQSLKDILLLLVGSGKMKPKLNEAKIQQVWKENMGTTINAYTKSIAVHRNILYITIESSPLKQELFYGRDKIKDMMNDELGEVYIKEVMII